MLFNMQKISGRQLLSGLATILVALLCFIGLVDLSCQAAQTGTKLMTRPAVKSRIPSAKPTTSQAHDQADSAAPLISLPEIVRQTMKVHFGDEALGTRTLEQFVDGMHVERRFYKSAGLFVTLSHNGKTRACWGSVYPEEATIKKSTVYSTISALTKEYRYPAIRRSEWRRLKAQVTVIKNIEPISSIAFLNPLRDGLLVRSNGKGGVILPGEAIDAHYQLVMCKLKAGIKSGEPCQLYRLRTEIYD